jgi:hypothetical protein
MHVANFPQSQALPLRASPDAPTAMAGKPPRRRN